MEDDVGDEPGNHDDPCPRARDQTVMLARLIDDESPRSKSTRAIEPLGRMSGGGITWTPRGRIDFPEQRRRVISRAQTALCSRFSSWSSGACETESQGRGTNYSERALSRELARHEMKERYTSNAVSACYAMYRTNAVARRRSNCFSLTRGGGNVTAPSRPQLVETRTACEGKLKPAVAQPKNARVSKQD